MATAKQKKAFKEIVENSRNKGEALRMAGYSEATAIKPTQVTNSKGWQELLDEYMPEDELAKLHAEGLRSSELPIRHRYLDTAYKLRGSYAPDKQQIQVEDVTDESVLDELLDKLDSKLKAQYVGQGDSTVPAGEGKKTTDDIPNTEGM